MITVDIQLPRKKSKVRIFLVERLKLLIQKFLIENLEKCGVGGIEPKWFEFYLSDKKQREKLDSDISTVINVEKWGNTEKCAGTTKFEH